MSELSFFHGICNSVIYNWDNEEVRYLEKYPAVLFEQYLRGKKLPEEEYEKIDFLKKEYPQAEVKEIIEKPSFNEFRMVHFEITDRCNLRCIHCYGDFPKSGETVSIEEFEEALSKLSSIAPVSVLQITGGEASLVDGLEEYVSIGSEYSSHVQLFTNGTNFDKEKIRKLKENGLDKIRVTLFSSNLEVHDEITQRKGSWKKAVQTIKNCQDIDLSVSIETPLMEENYRTKEETKDFAQDLGVNNRQCEVISSGRRENSFPDEKGPRDSHKSFNVPNELVRTSIEYDNCLWERIAIHPDLTYSTCVFMDENIGNLKKQSKEDIKNTLLEEWSKYKPDNLGPCKNCEFRYLCKRCRPQSEGEMKKEEYCGYSPGSIPTKRVEHHLYMARNAREKEKEILYKLHLLLAREWIARCRSIDEYGVEERFKEYVKELPEDLKEGEKQLWSSLEKIKKKYD